MIEPGIYNITCPQGATFSRRFTYSIGGTAVNLTGYTAAMQVRESYDEDAVVSLTSASGSASCFNADCATPRSESVLSASSATSTR